MAAGAWSCVITSRRSNSARGRLTERRMTLEVSEEARRHIARQGFDPVYGARPLRRFIAHQVETRLGRALLAGDVGDGATLVVDVVDGELVVTWENPDAGTDRVLVGSPAGSSWST